MRRFWWILPVAALSACAVETPASFTQVNGFGVKVQQIDGDPPTYRAQGASNRDRARLDAAYYARNVIGIRNVAGCPIKPELIRHDADGPTTIATTVCP
ncbi:hypothetical protein KDD17_16265 [Sulfitobacter albidus]|uniref:Lipoprotein n=1 Tax=Sulfitobacter albidus TaxID=2829501 RepID=A0A975PM72_9RHOB|nr:hypothetical protein [Sulfitobacter albidus]QUJ76414.1 hypothetical protein KDD17_16265 [Sulfitobacter albidus]